MAIRVKVSKTYFDKVEPQGWVDGLLLGKQGCWVYVELGDEFEYIRRPSDDAKTDYRIFRGCTTCYATSLEDLENGNFLGEAENQTVIIYY